MADAAGVKAGEGAQTPGPKATASEELPKLSPQDFRVYNRMAEHMNYFHNYFRQSWTILYNAASTGERPARMSIRQFLRLGLDFLQGLEVHHSIEEEHIFPVLARKMPSFSPKVHLLTQHKEIHKGMERMEQYLEACRDGEKDLRMEELKEVMDSFGKVLWAHLEDEVKELGAENMRKFWSKEEMRMLPM